jgi:hypothetical protein
VVNKPRDALSKDDVSTGNDTKRGPFLNEGAIQICLTTKLRRVSGGGFPEARSVSVIACDCVVGLTPRSVVKAQIK